MRRFYLSIFSFTVISSIFLSLAQSQIDGPMVHLRRGMVWNSYYYGKVCAPFSNWTRINYGLDSPGYDPEWIGAPVGGPTSYISTGGMWIASKNDTGKIIAVEDWAMYGSTVGTEGGSKYKILKHTKRWQRGQNFWLQADPAEAQEVIDSEWEMNPNYIPQYTGDLQLPLNVKRTVRQWAGNSNDERYMIVEYVLKNISATDTLRRLYSMLTYAFSANYRGWATLFANFNQGARNNRFLYGSSKTMYAYADDYPETPTVNEKFNFYPQGGPSGYGEYLSPGYVGFRLLYSSADTTGRETRINKYAWSAAPDQQDLYGPFGSASMGLEARYNILADPSLASEAFTNPFDSRQTRRRCWSLMSLGPWTLKPQQSIKIVIAEFVSSPTYAQANDSGATAYTINTLAQAAFKADTSRAMLAFRNNYNIPDAPAVPDFSLELGKDPAQVVNYIKWKNDVEAIPDPDYTGPERFDLGGYRIYRSGYLPLGPWKKIADIKKGDVRFFDPSANRYTFKDTTVAIGSAYYYAITSYDTGHAAWPPKPSEFPSGVPSQESSIYSSLYRSSALDMNVVVSPFSTTIPAASAADNILVVPNPFVLESGTTIPQNYSRIQFINVPSPCTIRIYTIRGDLVKTIDHNDGSGIALWNQQTDYGQFAVSGVYIYHIEAPGGISKVGKLAIVR